MCFVDEYRDKNTEVRSLAHVPKERKRLVKFNGIDKVTASL